MDIVTDFLAYSDTLGNGQKCHCKRGVIVTSQFYCWVNPIEVKIVSLYCVTVTSVKVSGEICKKIQKRGRSERREIFPREC